MAGASTQFVKRAQQEFEEWEKVLFVTVKMKEE